VGVRRAAGRARGMALPMAQWVAVLSSNRTALKIAPARKLAPVGATDAPHIEGSYQGWKPDEEEFPMHTFLNSVRIGLKYKVKQKRLRIPAVGEEKRITKISGNSWGEAMEGVTCGGLCKNVILAS